MQQFLEFCAVRILQYRSVAFITYTSELSAQFAKEAMACQSLDNDEILNVRWATEDPNPESKVQEKRRLEEMGQEAIQARMDPGIVDAMRAVKALEEGVELDQDGLYLEDGAGGEDGQEQEEQEDGRERKRMRMEIEDAVPEQQQQEKATPAPSTGLLSADTLESLKYFAEIRQRTNGAPPAAAVKKQVPVTPVPAGLGLADYGSDDDDE